MTVLAVSAHHRARHARPHFVGVRNLVSVRIPKAINTLWNFGEAYPRFVIAAAFLGCAGALAWWLPLGASLLAGITVFLLGRSVGLASSGTLREKFADAERELVLARANADQAAAELTSLRAELAAMTAASVRTMRMPAVEDGQGDDEQGAAA